MNRYDFDRHHVVPKRKRKRDRVVDWLGAQGPLLLSLYMCSAAALVVYVVDVLQ